MRTQSVVPASRRARVFSLSYGIPCLLRYLPGLTLLLFLPVSVFSQATSPMYGPDPSYTSPNSNTTSGQAMAPPGYDPADEQRRLQLVIVERHDSMVSDTNKLLKLAQDLNDEINRTNPESLTPAQLSKIAEIQKLAHKVKSEMADSFRDTSRLGH